MRKIQILVATVAILMAGTESVFAQGFFKRLGEAVKRTAENVVESKAVQKTSDVIEGAIDGAKKGAKGNNDDEPEVTASDNGPKVNTSTDFKRGGKILFQDDFQSEKVGEFPSKWDLLAGKAEVKKFGNQLAVEVTEDGVITPLIKQEGAYLTEEFTIEFDFYY